MRKGWKGYQNEKEKMIIKIRQIEENQSNGVNDVLKLRMLYKSEATADDRPRNRISILENNSKKGLK